MTDPPYEAEVLAAVWNGWEATALPAGRRLVAVALQRGGEGRGGLAIQWTDLDSGVAQTRRFALSGDEAPGARARAVLEGIATGR